MPPASHAPAFPRRVLLGAVVAFAAPVAARAQPGWPDRPFRWISPSPPGSAADVLSRLVTDRLSARLGQPVVVENRPGAGTNIGMAQLARAAADGYTLGLASAASPAAANATGGARHAFGAWLEPRTLLIGLVVLGAALTEGSANDWVGLAVVDGFHQENAVGALTFGLFVTAMTGMRLLGTGLLDRYGRIAVLRLCALLSITGLLIFGLVPTLPLALVGVVLWGAGAALGFPVGMSAASDDPVRAAARVSVVSTIGYTAFLAGPPLLGLLAAHVGYRHALLAIAAPVIIALFVLPAAAPLPTAAGQPRPDTSA